MGEALSAFDVGVVAPLEVSCPDERIEIFTDDEDSANNGRRDPSGWLGAVRSDLDTLFVFCRVDGREFHHLAEESSEATNYSVLQLGEKCPNGSAETFWLLDNENDEPVKNWSSGDIRPNVSGVDTELHFCVFAGQPSAKGDGGDFPDFGIPYGVFASPERFEHGLESGWFRINCEEDRNHNTSGGDLRYAGIGSAKEDPRFGTWRVR